MCQSHFNSQTVVAPTVFVIQDKNSRFLGRFIKLTWTQKSFTAAASVTIITVTVCWTQPCLPKIFCLNITTLIPLMMSSLSNCSLWSSGSLMNYNTELEQMFWWKKGFMRFPMTYLLYINKSHSPTFSSTLSPSSSPATTQTNKRVTQKQIGKEEEHD